MKKSIRSTPKKAGSRAKILGVSLDSTSQALLLRKISQKIRVGKRKIFLVTPNPEFLVFAHNHPWFKKVLNKADFAIPDGVGLIWVSDCLGHRPAIKERITGVDLMEKLCQEAAHHGWSVYFFGGEPGVAQETLVVLKKRYPRLKGWAESGPRIDLSITTSRLSPQKEIAEWVKRINSQRPDLLFVALGMGKQEKFIWDNWKRLDVKLAMGIGGAFNYLSGRVPRAPKWLRNIGLEWLYRLIRQPWRLRRQLRLLKFCFLVLREKIWKV